MSRTALPKIAGFILATTVGAGCLPPPAWGRVVVGGMPPGRGDALAKTGSLPSRPKLFLPHEGGGKCLVRPSGLSAGVGI